MSRLIARILLSIFIFPLAAILYMVAFFLFIENYYRVLGMNGRFRHEHGFIFGGVVAWGFIGLYWWLLWRKDVRWTGERILLTLGAVVPAGAAAVVAGAVTSGFEEEFGYFIGSVTAPLLWLVASVFVWRESAGERAARMSASGKSALVCPTCGYNLTGLSEPRCPECGSRFTLDQLLAAQPWNREM